VIQERRFTWFCNTASVFQFRRPEDAEITIRIAAAGQLPHSSPAVLTLSGLASSVPAGFAHDLSRSELGTGEAAFLRARRAMQQWRHFDLGWVFVANPKVAIHSGEIVAVIAHTAGLWSLNLSRIIEVRDDEANFGFVYATTPDHVEDGQERFLLAFDQRSGSVYYFIEAISRPRHPLARLAYPFSRAMQHRFSRESHLCMKSAIADI
jgi:uncharacterized protein (UPF0548 family)